MVQVVFQCYTPDNTSLLSIKDTSNITYFVLLHLVYFIQVQQQNNKIA